MGGIRDVWERLSSQEQLDFLLYAIEHRPNPWENLARQLGFENTGKAFDLNLADQSIKDARWREILCNAENVLLEVKGQPAASETGNVYIETWSRGRPSGISISRAEWFVLPLDGAEFKEEVAIIVKAGRLRYIMSTCWEQPGGDNGVARGKLVPIRKLVLPNRKIEKVQMVLC